MEVDETPSVHVSLECTKNCNKWIICQKVQDRKGCKKEERPLL